MQQPCDASCELGEVKVRLRHPCLHERNCLEPDCRLLYTSFSQRVQSAELVIECVAAAEAPLVGEALGGIIAARGSSDYE